MIRYFILEKDCKKYSSDSEFKITLDMPSNGDEPIYIDILLKEEWTYKVLMSFKDGTVIAGYIAYKPNNPIKILNQEELLDGRFNSYTGFMLSNYPVQSAKYGYKLPSGL